MAAVLFSWKKGVETSTLWVVMFMFCIRMCLTFLERFGCSILWRRYTPPHPPPLELRGNVHGCCGCYSGIHRTQFLSFHITRRTHHTQCGMLTVIRREQLRNRKILFFESRSIRQRFLLIFSGDGNVFM